MFGVDFRGTMPAMKRSAGMRCAYVVPDKSVSGVPLVDEKVQSTLTPPD